MPPSLLLPMSVCKITKPIVWLNSHLYPCVNAIICEKQYNNWINYSTPSHQGFDKFVHELETNELKQTPCLNRNSLYSQL